MIWNDFVLSKTEVSDDNYFSLYMKADIEMLFITNINCENKQNIDKPSSKYLRVSL